MSNAPAINDYYKSRQLQREFAVKVLDAADVPECTTMAQRAMIRAVIEAAANDACVGVAEDAQHEVKNLEIEAHGTRGRLVVRIEIGRVNDENTMGYFFRTRGQFFIGRRGGVSFFQKNHSHVTHGGRHLYLAFRR